MNDNASDGQDRDSRARLMIDGLHVALKARGTRPFRAWLKLALRWSWIPTAEQLRRA